MASITLEDRSTRAAQGAFSRTPEENSRYRATANMDTTDLGYSGNLVDDAKHINALTFPINDMQNNKTTWDQSTIDEYNNALQNYEKRYGVNPGVVPTRGYAEDEMPPNSGLKANEQTESGSPMFDPNSQYAPGSMNPAPPKPPGYMSHDDYSLEFPKTQGAPRFTNISDEQLTQDTETSMQSDTMKRLQDSIAADDAEKAVEPTPEQDKSHLARFFSDLYTGIKASPQAYITGTGLFVGNLLKSADEFTSYLLKESGAKTNPGVDTENPITQLVGALMGGKDAQGQVKPEGGNALVQQMTANPTVRENVLTPEGQSVAQGSNTGALIEGAVQFTEGFIPIMKSLKGLTVGMKGGSLVAGLLSAFGAGATVFDPAEGNLANYLKDANWTPELLKDIASYFAVDGDDSALKARLKNGLVTGGMQIAADGLVAVFGMLKNSRSLKGKTVGVPDTDNGGLPKNFVPTIQHEVTTPGVNTVKYPGGPPAPTGAATKPVEGVNSSYENGVHKGKPGETHEDIINRTLPKVATGSVEELTNQLTYTKQRMADVQARAKVSKASTKKLTDAREQVQDMAEKLTNPKLSAKGKATLTQSLEEQRALVEQLQLSKKRLSSGDQATLNQLKAEHDAITAQLSTARPTADINVENATAAERGNTSTLTKPLLQAQEGEGHAEILARNPKVQNPVKGYTNTADNSGNKIFYTEEKAQEIAKAQAMAKAAPYTFKSKPGEPFGDPEVEKAVKTGKASIKTLVKTLNTATISKADHIKEAVDRLTALTPDLKGKEPDIKDIVKLAQRLGVDPQDMVSAQKDLQNGADKVAAYNHILDASDNNIQTTAKEIVNNTEVAASDDALAQFIKLVNTRQAINKYLSDPTAASQVDGLLKDNVAIAPDVYQQTANSRSTVAQAGGAEHVKSLAMAIDQAGSWGTVAKALRDNSKSAFTDALTSYWYWSLLSGTQTHALNFQANALNLFWNIGARAMAGQINKLRNTGGGVQAGEANQMLYGIMQSFRTATRASWRTYVTGKSSITKMEGQSLNAISSAKLGGGPVFGKVWDAMGWLFNHTGSNILLATDEWYKVMATHAQMRALAFREGVGLGKTGKALADHIEATIQNPSKLMAFDAEAFAKDVTFTAELGEFGQKFQAAINTYPALKLIIPFVRTPANIAKQALKNGPLGLLSKKMWVDVAKGNARGQVALSKALVGTALAGMVIEESFNGRVTGYGPHDPAMRKTWLDSHRPFSIAIPTAIANLTNMAGFQVKNDQADYTWVSYNRYDPFGMMIGLSASAGEIWGQLHPETTSDVLGMIGTAGAQSFINKTWATGPAGFIEFITDPESPDALTWIKRQAGSLLVPAAASQLTKYNDPVFRDTSSWSQDPVWQDVLNQYMSKMPGLSENLPPMQNIAGQNIEGGALGPDIISSLYQNTPDGKPFFNWAWDNQIPLEMPSRVQFGNKDNGGVELSPEEYHKFVSLAGNELKDPDTGLGWYDTMNAIMAGKHEVSGEWQMATNGPFGGKALITQQLLRKFRESAKFAMVDPDSPYYMPQVAHRLDQAQMVKENNLTIGPGEE